MKNINERIAATVTNTVCNMRFLYGFCLFIALWMEFAPYLGIDKGPWYPVMLYYVNLFQGIMLPILAVGQSVLNKKTEEQQKHLSVLTEASTQMLRNQQRTMESIVALLKRDIQADEQQNALLEDLRRRLD